MDTGLSFSTANARSVRPLPAHMHEDVLHLWLTVSVWLHVGLSLLLMWNGRTVRGSGCLDQTDLLLIWLQVY